MDLEAERTSQLGVAATDRLLPDTPAPPAALHTLALSLDAKHEAPDADDVEEQSSNYVSLLRADCA